MNFASVMNDITARRHRYCTVRIEFLPCSDPPRTRQNHEETVVGMEMRPAHVAWQPSQAHNVWPRLIRIAKQHSGLIGSSGVPHPLDVGGSLEVHRGAI